MMALLRWLFGNLGIKMMSLLLAMLVFLHVATDREQELKFRVPLRLVNLSDSLVAMGRVPGDALVSFRGRGRDIYLALLRGTWVQVDLAEAGPGSVRHLLSPRDVQLPPGITVSAAQVAEPETLALQMDRRQRARLPVRVVTESRNPALACRAEPESVNVDGPASLLARMSWVPTEPFHPRREAAGSEGTVALRPGSPYLNVSPPQVRAKVISP
ncbi:MAG: hypothetical protein HZB25_02225 [Candidatus Eisenbacteria bacterium]|nr:hypothetical protein [Candidatus Eisenbacteria bacterium]